jgi:hypothetical protein
MYDHKTTPNMGGGSPTYQLIATHLLLRSAGPFTSGFGALKELVDARLHC